MEKGNKIFSSYAIGGVTDAVRFSTWTRGLDKKEAVDGVVLEEHR